MATNRAKLVLAVIGLILSLLLATMALAESNSASENQQTINDYNKAIELNPKDADAYYNRGNAYKVLRNFKQAISDYNKAIELDPKDADAYRNRGIAYKVLGNFEQAINDYSKAIELDPKDADAYYNRGVVNQASGNLE